MNEHNYPRSLLFFDGETWIHEGDKKELHTLRLGVCIYVDLDKNQKVLNREIFHFYTADEFWMYVELKAKENRKLWLYAHNIKYDLASVSVLENTKKYGWKTGFPIMENAFIMSSKKGKKKLQYVDTHNYLKTSLEAIGKKVGLPKMDKPDFKSVDDSYLKQYCQRDVEVIEKFILDFIRFLADNKLGSLKYTMASTAFNSYRTRFMTKEIYHYSTFKGHIQENIPMHTLERNAYKGGRVDCFFIGEKHGDFYNLDVNSMYPYVMSNISMPIKPIAFSDDINIHDLKLIMLNRYVIAEVTYLENNIHGRIALKHNDMLEFPSGLIRNTVHHSELQYMLDHKIIKEIHQVIVYERTNIFKDYVDFFYELKKNATNESEREMSKLFLNSLYGRFGMRYYSSETPIPYPDEPENGSVMWDDSTGKKQLYYWWDGHLCKSNQSDYIPVKNTNLAIAGCVTSEARMLLLKYIEICGYENLYYVDTDSVICNRKGYENLKDYLNDKELGFLKLEKQANYLKINAPKDYIFGDKIRSKGVPMDSTTNLDGTFSYWIFSTFKQHIKSNGKFLGRQRIDKKNSYTYNKGRIIINGVCISNEVNNGYPQT